MLAARVKGTKIHVELGLLKDNADSGQKELKKLTEKGTLAENGQEETKKLVEMGTQPDVELVEMGTRAADVKFVEMGTQANVELFKATHRPEDPAISSYIRARELDAMMKIGVLRAQAVQMGAGFLGGASKTVVALWFAASGVVFVFIAYLCYGIFKSPELSSIPYTWTYLISMVPAFSLFFFRAYYLMRKMYQEAYTSLVYSTASACFTQLINIVVRVLYLQYRSASRPYMCGNRRPYLPECSGWRFRIGLKLIVIYYVMCVCACIMGIVAAAYLSENRIMAASNTIRYALAVIGAAFLVNAVGLFMVAYNTWVYLSLLVVALCAVLFTYLTWRRNQQRERANRKVDGDRKVYDALWETFIGEHANLSELEDILMKCCETEDLNPTARQSKKVLYNGEDITKSQRPRQAIKDLTVLFAQADEMNPHFQRCVAKWCSGVSGSKQSVASVKRKTRAIEKLYRSYGGDASQLIDLVRSSITFTTIESLTETLKNIIRDRTVAVLQYKNRFCADYDSMASAGYRNIALSLIVVDETTMQSGVDCHICELQLALSMIEEKKNDEGHRRYVEWRNILAE